ncbi:Hsp20/alpha crystallin family protein [Bdellovibrio bacteriovorus]|uniref:Hsp20/alpha crystallin family protein n=1 Tax=Bdellovibrio TaxID=958 RepID=UPI0035A838EB
MPIRGLTPWHAQLAPRDSQFEEFINEFDSDFRPGSLTSSEEEFSPALEVEENENAYLVSIDLPGLKKKDIKVGLGNNILTVTGERQRRFEGEEKYTERTYGKFVRSFSVPSEVDADKIDARFEDGVLLITLPKTEGARSHTIKIS